jgi:hypothetical protein
MVDDGGIAEGVGHIARDVEEMRRGELGENCRRKSQKQKQGWHSAR